MTARLISRGSVLALLFAGACMQATSVGNGNGNGNGKGGSAGSTTSDNTKPTGAGGGSSTTGAGGSSTTGAGGGGGTMVVQKLCATKTTVTNPVLFNFENYNGTIDASQYITAFGSATPNQGTAYAGLYAFGDMSATPTLSIMAGHPPSMWAASETVTLTSNWGMGGGLWMGCANASAYKGISLWVRGTAPLSVFQFSVNMESTSLPDSVNPTGGGTCPGTADTCTPPTKTNIPLTADWTQVQIMWADFAPGMSGTTAVVPNGDNITGLAWSVPLQFVLSSTAMGDAAGPYVPMAAGMTINIDDISFIQ
jgi:hypothetical protein